jgi:hypothetical protein
MQSKANQGKAMRGELSDAKINKAMSIAKRRKEV